MGTLQQWKSIRDKGLSSFKNFTRFLYQLKINFNDIEYKKSRTYRVIVTFNNGSGCGSGFFASDDKFLTCFHVIFGCELNKIRKEQQFLDTLGNTEHEKLKNYFVTKIVKIEVEIGESRYIATLTDFDERYDIASLSIDSQNTRINISKLNLNPKITHGSQLFFAGFPTHHDYTLDTAPLAVHQGILSAFVNTTIGGDKYFHLQINSINLGGNSGAPLFSKKGRRVIGIINGNMNWGRDDIASIVPNPMVGNAALNFNSISFRVPLSIAYATTLETIKKETSIF